MVEQTKGDQENCKNVNNKVDPCITYENLYY